MQEWKHIRDFVNAFSAPKPKVYTGIVKYVGVLDRHDYSKRVYVGVRLDAPGMYE